MSDRPTIRIDTREQRPWSFPPHQAAVVRGTVPAGDYALDGDQEHYAIERKNLDDFIGSISSTWDQLTARFSDTMRIIIIEGDYRQCLFDEGREPQHNHPRIQPAFVQKRIAELMYHYQAQVFFAGRAEYAAALCWRILFERWKEVYSDET